jgi:hypothetical protein
MHQIDFCRTECRRGQRKLALFSGGRKDPDEIADELPPPPVAEDFLKLGP